MSEKKTYRLGDICKNVCSGGTPKSTNPLYYDGDIPWLNTKEIDFNRISSTQRCITQEGLDNSSAKWIDAYCVIVAMYGATAGKVAINTIPLTTNQACCNLSLDENIADYKYVYYYLCAHYFELASLANGGAQQNLNAQQIKAFEISLPPLSEQKRIAGILGALDDKIELNRRINANLEAQAMALYKHWFVDEQQENWEEKKLGDIVDVYDSLRKPLSGQQREKMAKIYPYYGAASLMDYVEHYLFDGIYLLLGEDGTVSDENGYPSLQYVWGQFWVNNHAHVLTGKSGYSTEMLYILLKQTKVHSIITGAVQPKINQANLLSLPVVCPPKDMLNKYNEIIQPLFTQLRNNSEQVKHLSALRDALLPKLMGNQCL